jgi:hypothetical protein
LKYLHLRPILPIHRVAETRTYLKSEPSARITPLAKLRLIGNLRFKLDRNINVCQVLGIGKHASEEHPLVSG